MKALRISLNFYIICQLLGTVFMFLGLFLISAVAVGIFYGEGKSIAAYTFSVILIEIIAISLYFFGKDREKGPLMRKEAIATVAISWIGMGILGAIPYILDGGIQNPIDAFFESVSGFTTTGSSILTDIESLSHASLFWRSLTQWLGGMGIIVLFVAIFPQLGVGAKQLFKSEVPGPITEGIKPRIKETSSLLWKIYLGLTVLLTLILYFGGMTFFDAICHSFTTMATGGFSTKNASIKFYDSAFIDYAITLFMLLASLNFTLYYMVLKGNTIKVTKDAELRVYLAIISITLIVVVINTLSHFDEDFFNSFRYSLFQIVSLITTTGFATYDYELFPVISKIMLVSVMFVGGCAGSTAGGIKVSRILMATKASVFDIYKNYQPQHIKSIKINNYPLSQELIKGVLTFIYIYFLIVLFGTIFMSTQGLDFETSFTSVLTCLSNVGPGLGSIGPTENFYHISGIGKLFLSFCMIMGRLELYTFLVLFIPAFWRR
ncbi:MAG: TrkH family potassium uptake protein [Calditrichaeota bacterium]|nr:TrkH family potassium uptake protein [Calditrichota bacterium]